MIDLAKEKVKPIAKLNFYRAVSPSLQTCTRWTVKGVLSIDGRCVKLEALKIGAQWYSSQESVDRFIAAINTPAESLHSFTSKQRLAQNEVAKRVLKNAGI